MSKVVSEGMFICEDDKRVFAVDADLMDDGSVRIVKGAKVLSKATDGSEGPLAKGSGVLPMFHDAIAKARSQVTKAASGSRGAGEVDSLMLDPSSGIKDSPFVPNGGFTTPTGLGNSSARLPDGRPPLYAEIDAGSTGEHATDKALANARAKQAAREARSAGPSIETSRIR